MLSPIETHALTVYGSPVRHEIGLLFGKEMHRFVVNAGTAKQFVTQWSDNENALFRTVVERVGKKGLRLV